ncbi:protein-L-isoaspartate O-methyltransferase [Candidatus Saccharibacteria bacterium]|nr:protein-L-isoaspartate O-methyltransferase [Candidatus Saccharibacteria bacterium]
MVNKIDEAFKATPRINFLRTENKIQYEIDAPLSIGYGQTNSQPSTVRRMLQWLDPQSGDNVLDVGSGSGWTTALLAHLIGPTSTVYAVEKIADLMKFGEENCQRMNVRNVLFFEAGDVYGLPDLAPYDRILVSAATTELSIVLSILLAQLKIGGRIVIPSRTIIHVIDKVTNDDYSHKEHPGYVFVPLI